MNFLLEDLSGLKVYLDDIICTDEWTEHLQRLGDVLKRLRDHHLTINMAKICFCSALVTYLGHEVGHGCFCPKTANVDAIIAYPAFSTRKALMHFLGMVGYYRRYCPNFSAVAASLTRLTSNKAAFEWIPECQASFNELNNSLMHDPVLAASDSRLSYNLQTDASEDALGAVLLQERDVILHPVVYHSATFNKHQGSYNTIEKELLSVILAIKKFECYAHGQQQLQVYTNHNPLTFLMRNQFSNQRLLHWSLFLESYDIKMKHI